MAKEKEIKTNAMRILDRQKIKYEVLQYECDEFIDGLHTAEKTGAPVEQLAFEEVDYWDELVGIMDYAKKPARRSNSRLKRLWHREKASSIMCWCFRSQRKWI